MKKLLLFLVITSFLLPNSLKAQNEGQVAAVAAGALLTIGAGVAAVEQMKERAELTATEWILANHSELQSFSLSTLDFDGKKMKDLSSTTVISFKVQGFKPTDNPILDGKKQILFGFTSHGWITQYGIDFDKVDWFLIDQAEWINMMTSYVKVASTETDDNSIKEKLKNGKVVNRGVKIKSKLVIPFFKLSGDMYVVTDYSDKLKLIYNERSLGIFLKETMSLVQIKRKNIIDIHYFFLNKTLARHNSSAL